MSVPPVPLNAKAAYDEAVKRIKGLGRWWRKEPSKLDLSDLGLTTVPPEIGQLADLQLLDLSGNQLTALPPELGRLVSLPYLDLRSNLLARLSPVIGKLTGLRGLDLRNNLLTALPPEIGELTALTQLYLIGNRLAELPPEIGKLTALTNFDLERNRLATLPPEIGRLTALKGLDLRRNQLNSLPPQIGQLAELAQLNLGGNELRSLPPQIGLLTALTSLDLSSNRLVTLPPEMVRLTSLMRLFLHDNPDLGLPREVMGPSRGDVDYNESLPAAAHSVLGHYFALQHQGGRPLDEVRLVLVGRGGAGKTSLVQRLIKDAYDPAQKETPGIALCDWTLPGCAGAPVTAHVWDFAGQIITHSMHRYFLSHRTVYVLVLTQREDNAAEDADYWLKLIRSYGMGRQVGGECPPVLVALNKWDEGPVKVDRGVLREHYPGIAGFVETDCATGRGIKELRQALCSLVDDPAVKAWVRRDYPARWWHLKERLRKEQVTQPHLSFDVFRRLCEQCGVEDAEAAGRDLHTLGLALNYGLDPQWKDVLADTTVLRPGWVTHHCYTLIRHAEKHQGVLNHAELAGLLGEARDGAPGEADPHMHAYLMRLMERFEAAYPMGEEWPPSAWLVPLALPDSQPEGIELFGKVPPASASRLRYTYPTLPPGLMAQFIVRTHPLMEPGMQWASGTVLALNGARALVRAVSKTGIEITAIGESKDARRDLAGLCRGKLCELHRQASGLEVIERKQVEVEGEVVWANVTTLEQDELRGKKASGVETKRGTLEVDTKGELDDFGTEEGRLPEQGRDFQHPMIEATVVSAPAEGTGKPVRRSKSKPVVFISYSHSDERLRKTLELHLEVLKIQGLLHGVWHDRCIQPGMDWDKMIRSQLAAADVVLMLTSTASLASGYINQEELSPALERHASGEAVVVPIILEKCDWIATFAASKPLQKLQDPKRRVPQSLPRDGRYIRSFTPQSEGWHSVYEGLKSLLAEIKAGLQ